MNGNKKKLAIKFKSVRCQFGFTQQQVSNHLKVSRPSYTQIELGKRNITLIETIKLCELYKCGLDYLLNIKKPVFDKNKIDTAVNIAWALRGTKSEHIFKSYVRDAIMVIIKT